MDIRIYVDGSLVPRQVISEVKIVVKGLSDLNLEGHITFVDEVIMGDTLLDGSSILPFLQPYEFIFDTDPRCDECQAAILSLDPHEDGHGFVCGQCGMIFCSEHHTPGEETDCTRHSVLFGILEETDEEDIEDGPEYDTESEDQEDESVVAEMTVCRGCSSEFAVTYDEAPHRAALLYCPFCGGEDLEPGRRINVRPEEGYTEEEDSEEEEE